MLLHLRRAHHPVHVDRRANRQPLRGIKAQLIGAVQLLDIHQVLVVPDAVAHAHEDIGAAQERARFAGVLG